MFRKSGNRFSEQNMRKIEEFRAHHDFDPIGMRSSAARRSLRQDDAPPDRVAASPRPPRDGRGCRPAWRSSARHRARIRRMHAPGRGAQTRVDIDPKGSDAGQGSRLRRERAAAGLVASVEPGACTGAAAHQSPGRGAGRHRRGAQGRTSRRIVIDARCSGAIRPPAVRSPDCSSRSSPCGRCRGFPCPEVV